MSLSCTVVHDQSPGEHLNTYNPFPLGVLNNEVKPADWSRPGPVFANNIALMDGTVWSFFKQVAVTLHLRGDAKQMWSRRGVTSSIVETLVARNSSNFFP